MSEDDGDEDLTTGARSDGPEIPEEGVESQVEILEEELTFDGKPLATWTRRYPPEERQFLAAWGINPEDYPRAHEANLRMIEVGLAFDRGAKSLYLKPHGPYLLKKLFPPSLGETVHGVGGQPQQDRTVEDALARLEGKKRPPPARKPEEIEVQPDWLSMYPQEYARLLAEHGWPTVRGTQVDDYNRRLTELLSPDCDDAALMQDAAERALIYAFGGNIMEEPELTKEEDEYIWREVLLHEEGYERPDLQDVAWAYYPERWRPLLSSLGRPDYEHPKAPDYNRALIAGRMFLDDVGNHDSEATRTLRGYLWRAFFIDVPCPDE